MEKHTLKPLQSCRAIAFIGIFCSHVSESWAGSWGVSIFFVLSGFLIAYREVPRTSSIVSITDGVKYSFRKVKKLYGLHIAMFFAALPITIYNQIPNIEYRKLAVRALPNILLIQSWIPNPEFYFSYNGVSWFLSTIAFIWLVVPGLLLLLKRANSKVRSLEGIIAVIFVLLGIALFLEYATTLSYDTKKWITYVFPPYRMLEFFGGGYLGALFFNCKADENGNSKRVSANILGCFFVIWSTVMLVIAPKCPVSLSTTVLWLPGSLVLIWVAAAGKGWLADILSNKYLIRLGNISQYLFLVHQIVIRYVNGVLGRIIDKQKYFWLFVAVQFIASIIISMVIDKGRKRYAKRMEI